MFFRRKVTHIHIHVYENESHLVERLLSIKEAIDQLTSILEETTDVPESRRSSRCFKRRSS
jgi:hypothetical protein